MIQKSHEKQKKIGTMYKGNNMFPYISEIWSRL